MLVLMVLFSRLDSFITHFKVLLFTWFLGYKGMAISFIFNRLRFHYLSQPWLIQLYFTLKCNAVSQKVLNFCCILREIIFIFFAWLVNAEKMQIRIDILPNKALFLMALPWSTIPSILEEYDWLLKLYTTTFLCVWCHENNSDTHYPLVAASIALYYA